MKNIVLTGFMGTGKTEVGKELSRLLGMRVVDIDHEIEESQGSTISDIFADRGEDYFRTVETEVIRRISAQHGIIISTGGGAVLKEENVKALQDSGVIFCMTASTDTILRRTEGNDERPLLRCADKRTTITSLLEQRRPYYEKAGLLIHTDGKTPLQVAEEIIGKLPWRR